MLENPDKWHVGPAPWCLQSYNVNSTMRTESREYASNTLNQNDRVVAGSWTSARTFYATWRKLSETTTVACGGVPAYRGLLVQGICLTVHETPRLKLHVGPGLNTHMMLISPNKDVYDMLILKAAQGSCVHCSHRASSNENGR